MKKIEITWIIDDDPIFIFGLKKKIKQLNFSNSTIISWNGEEALDKLHKLLASQEEQFPNLILLDLNMPNMDGWQFLEEYEKFSKEKNAVIFLITSSIDPADVVRAKNYNRLNGYIIKPLKTEQFQEIQIEYNKS